MATFAEQVEFLNVPQFDPSTNLRYQSGYVKVLDAGTSNLSTVYSARDKGGTFTNPFALDSDDTKEIYLDTGVYDFELYEGDPDDVDNPGVKRDTISGMTYGLSDNSVDDLLDGGYDKTIKSADIITKGPWVDVRAFGATGDGVTDDTSALSSANAVGTSLLFPSGTYVSSDLTITADCIFLKGASIKPANGQTVTISGSITSPDQVIFDGGSGGLFDLTDSMSTMRLTWFSGSYANDKWDNAVSWYMGSGQGNSYHFIIPRPAPQYSATAVVLVNGRYYWQIDDTLNITNDCSEGDIFIEGAFYAPATVGAKPIIVIGDADKINNLTIHGDIIAHAASAGTTTNCVEINGCARLSIPGTINTQYGDYGTMIGGPNLADNAGAISIGQLHTYGYRYRGHQISGNGAFSVSGVDIGVIFSSSPNSNLTNVDFGLGIGGGVQNYTIRNYVCTTAGAGEEDPVGALTIYGDSTVTSDGGGNKGGYIEIVNCPVCDDYLLFVDGDNANANVENVTIGELIATANGASPTANVRATSLDWASRFTIQKYNELTNDITIGANCGRVEINGIDNNGVTVTNSGPRTIINGLGYESGILAAAKPSNNWHVGDVIVNDADSPHTIWRKTQHTGVAATDFIQVG